MAIKTSVTTPLRADTYKSLQLNAGVLIYNTDISQYSDAESLKTALAAIIADGSKLLGATRGGGTCVITRDTRKVEVDGARANFVGGTIVDGGDAYISVTLLEQTPEHIKYVIGNADIDDDAPNHVKVKIRLAIDDSDYIQNVIWIGDTSEGFMAIELYNGLNTADVTFTWADKNEGTVNAEFHAHQSGIDVAEYLPIVLHYLTPSTAMGSITVSSAAGTNVGETDITKDYTLASGEKFVYKVGTSGAAPAIAYNEKADYTWEEWDGSSAINVGASANGKKATIAVVKGGKALMSGSCTLVVKTA